MKNIEDMYPLTPMQEGLLFHGLYAPGSEAYFMQLSCSITGRVEVKAFQQAWATLLKRHAILRTSFVWEGLKQSLQVVHKEVSLPWREEDWRELNEEEQEEGWRSFLQKDRERGFDFAQAPLMRFTLIRTGSGRYRFVWSTHHILFDGWSVQVLMTEVFALYEGYREGQEAKLAFPQPYRNYIAWLQQQDLTDAQAFWRQELQGFREATPLGIERPRPHGEGTEEGAGEKNLRLSEKLTRQLESLGRGHQVTLNTVMQGAWGMLLSRYSGERDVVFGATVSGRSVAVPGIEAMVGLFINTLPVRIRLGAGDTVGSYLKELQARQLQARQYEYSPLVQVQGWSEVAPGTGLFDSILVYENYPLDVSWNGLANPHLQISTIQGFDRTHYALTLLVIPGEQLLLRVKYDPQRFEEGNIEGLLGHLERLLEGMAVGGERRVLEIPLLRAEERQQLVEEWNRTEAAYRRDRCIHELFEEQVERNPEAIAVVYEEEELTYGELNRRANQLAHYLRRLGVGVESTVGLCLERSLEMIVGLLGIMKAGGAYVPLDAEYPGERLRYMLEDARAAVLVTQEGLVKSLRETAGQIVCLDRDREKIAGESVSNPQSGVTPDNLVYVIYTSGSTGKPKGVAIVHGAVCNLWCALDRSVYRNRPTNLRIAMNASLVFDASVKQWIALLGGHTICIIPQHLRSTPDELVSHCRSNRIDALDITPSQLSPLLVRGILRSARLGFLLIGGEAIPAKQWIDLQERLGHDAFNVYGPTETTVDAAVCNIQSNSPHSIGRPIANTQIYITDEGMEPVPVGIAGELYIGGLGLARGYVNRGDITAERFVPNPFSARRGERLYRTGDWARYQRDGNIEFLGRMDDQVKVRGYRIELGEIEAVLREHGSVEQAVVVVREDEPGEKRLVGYVVGKRGEEGVSGIALRKYLRNKLPEYMVPGMWVVLDELPLTTNGKLDRRRLPKPEHQDVEQKYVAPRSSTEKTLVEIWRAVLGLERIGVEDNFFELGGDSIISIQVVAKARKVGLQLSPKDLFEHPTIATLAAASTHALNEFEQGPVTGEVPLTPIQRHFCDRGLKNPHYYNQAILLGLRSGLTSALLEEALGALLQLHDGLRLRFEFLEGRWRQHYAAVGAELMYQRKDLSNLVGQEKRVVLEEDALRVQASLNLEEGPLVRAVEYELGAGKGKRLLLVVHHLVVDGVSWRILLQDLQLTYEQLAAGQPIQLPAKTTSFKGWSGRLQEYSAGRDLQAEIGYWTGKQQPGARDTLPIDYSAGENTVGSEGSISVSLTAEETHRLLHEVPSVYHTQINDFLLTAFTQTIARWTGENGVLVDLEGHGREDMFAGVDLSRTVGWFTTIYPIRLHAQEIGNLRQALLATKELLRQVPNRGIGYGILRYLSRDANVAQAMMSDPQAQIRFNYLGQFDQVFSPSRLFVPAEERYGQTQSSDEKRPYLLDLIGMIVSGSLRVSWSYSKNRHRRQTVKKLAKSFAQHLRDLIAHCKSPDAGGYTPSDFPLAKLDQESLDQGIGLKQGLEDMYPLTPMQEGLLFHGLYAPGSEAYFMQLSCSITGRVEVKAFQQAWATLLKRHAILRTSFVWEGLKQSLQVVHKEVSLPWREEDWRELNEEEQEEGWRSFLQKDRERGFDFAQAPLMRFTLIRTGSGRYRFVWSTHHILFDGWCRQLLIGEVFALYEGYREGQEAKLAFPQPYRNYIAWLQQQDLTDAQAFWRQELQGFREATPLGIERPRPHGEGTEEGAGEKNLRLSEKLTRQLESLGRGHQVTLNTVMQGAWGMLLSRYSGERDVVFGATVSGRSVAVPGIEAMVGLFINTLPVRIRLGAGDTVGSYLKELQARQLQARQYEYSPLVQVQGWSEVAPGTGLFDSILVYENYPLDVSWNGLANPHLQISTIQGFDRTHYALTLLVIPGEQLLLRVKYDPQRFEEGNIEGLLGHLERLLEGMAVGGERRVLEIPLLRAEERQQLVEEWNRTEAAYRRDRCIHELFEEQVERNPEAIAVVYEEEELTYGELNRRANQLAHYLRRLGVGVESTVGLCLERSLEMIVGLLGIMKAGGAYVPLDAEYPGERLRYMLEDARAAVLVTQEGLVKSLRETAGQIVCLDRDREKIAGESVSNPQSGVTPDNLVYVIYTSGSTGKPKGVMNVHAGLCNRLLWMQNRYLLSETDRVLQKTPFTFDVSVWEFFWPLIVAARLVMARPGGHRDSEYLVETIQHFGITTIHFVPAMLSAFLGEGDITDCHTLRRVICSGEALGIEIQNRFRQRLAIELHNLYGPTEASIDVTHWACHEGWEKNFVPIGRPIANTQIYITDEGMEPVPVGIAGELYIGGLGLARGYVNRGDITAERFVPNPFSARRGERLYRTGDWARYQRDGNIEFLGRMDDQVKVRGYRIELGEIEAVLREHGSVEQAVVVVREDEPGEKRLVGYVVGKRGEEGVSGIALRKYLRNKLPEYMVPGMWVVLDELPLTTNGKLDRRRLPKPEHQDVEQKYVAPRSSTEKTLVEIWRAVLECKQIGIHDNFFELGGHSLLLLRLKAEIRKAFNRDISIVDMFSSPSVCKLADMLDLPQGSCSDSPELGIADEWLDKRRSLLQLQVEREKRVREVVQ